MIILEKIGLLSLKIVKLAVYLVGWLILVIAIIVTVSTRPPRRYRNCYR